MSGAQWDRILDLNLKAAFFVMQASARLMIPAGYGRIVNIGSIGGRVGWARTVAYCASKGSLEQVTRVCALEWAPHGITVNTVSPALIDTPMTHARLETRHFARRFCRGSRRPRRHAGRHRFRRWVSGITLCQLCHGDHTDSRRRMAAGSAPTSSGNAHREHQP